MIAAKTATPVKIPKIIDGRGFLDKTKFENNTYYKIGLNEKK